MAFPTGGGSQQSLAVILNEILAKAAEVKVLASDFKAKLAAQNTPGTDVFAFCVSLVLAKLFMEIRSQVPNLREYAQQIFDDNTLEIVSEFQTMRANINTVLTSIDSQAPSALAIALYTPGNTAAIRNQLQTLIDSID